MLDFARKARMTYMDCSHCGKAFHDHWKSFGIGRAGDQRLLDDDNSNFNVDWSGTYTVCPSCYNATTDLTVTSRVDDSAAITVRVHPLNTYRNPTPKEVPGDLKEDYEEACKILDISHKASAALSRRCLQAILQKHGYNQKDLAKQIQALLDEPDLTKAIPIALRQSVDAIRNFGNFSAHALTDQTTLQVIAVDAGEAEWCLDILDDMFEHYYVKPKQVAGRKAALDAKLIAAGKPPSK
jgi:hypothetical protein